MSASLDQNLDRGVEMRFLAALFALLFAMPASAAAVRIDAVISSVVLDYQVLFKTSDDSAPSASERTDFVAAHHTMRGLLGATGGVTFTYIEYPNYSDLSCSFDHPGAAAALFNCRGLTNRKGDYEFNVNGAPLLISLTGDGLLAQDDGRISGGAELDGEGYFWWNPRATINFSSFTVTPIPLPATGWLLLLPFVLFRMCRRLPKLG